MLPLSAQWQVTETCLGRKAAATTSTTTSIPATSPLDGYQTETIGFHFAVMIESLGEDTAILRSTLSIISPSYLDMPFHTSERSGLFMGTCSAID